MFNEKFIVRYEQLELEVNYDSIHEWNLETSLVAKGYGVSIDTVLYHRKNNPEEFIYGKHFVTAEDISVVRFGQKPNTIFWTKKGIVRLGFFIKSEKAKKFRDWAEDLIINELNNFNIPKDYPSALRALAGEFERAEIAEKKIKELKPKGEAYDSFIEYDGFFNFKQVADLFDIPKVGRNEFMAMLRKDGILNERNEPYRTQINMGRFKTCLQDTNGIKVGHAFIPRYNTLISPKGIDYLFKKYKHLVLDHEQFNEKKYKLIAK